MPLGTATQQWLTVGIYIPQLPCSSGKNSNVCVLHWLPEFPSGIKLQSPTVVAEWITQALLAAFSSCLTSPLPCQHLLGYYLSNKLRDLESCLSVWFKGNPKSSMLYEWDIAGEIAEDIWEIPLQKQKLWLSLEPEQSVQFRVPLMQFRDPVHAMHTFSPGRVGWGGP